MRLYRGEINYSTPQLRLESHQIWQDEKHKPPNDDLILKALLKNLKFQCPPQTKGMMDIINYALDQTFM